MKTAGYACLGLGLLLILTALFTKQSDLDRGRSMVGGPRMAPGCGLLMGIIWIVTGVVLLVDG